MSEADSVIREPRRREPSDEGGPGHEETYWLRRKLDASIMHLRDIEDYYRLLGGLPEGFNQKRADRARQLYEAITSDFVNGRMSVPTLREERDALAAEVRQLREAMTKLEREFVARGDLRASREDVAMYLRIVRAALAAEAAR